jgi:hypothetical protein
MRIFFALRIFSSVLSALASCAMSIIETTATIAIPSCFKHLLISSPPWSRELLTH